MNCVILSGRLTKKPELIDAGEYKKAVFSLAMTVWQKNGEKTEFVDCEMWGKRGETLATHSDKGDQLIVRGSLRVENYETKYGGKKKRAYVNCDDFDYGAKSRHGGDGGDVPEIAPGRPKKPILKQISIYDEDAPF